MIVTDKLSTESFHAFIDEQLTDEQYVQVEAQLDEIPEKIEEIQQCQIINERLREVFDPIVEEPLPDDLLELGFYGIEGAATDTDSTDSTDYDDFSSPFTELEDDIAAIDSLDTFSEEEERSFIDEIDENEASDLEVLAKTEHLSGFDIDALRSDGSNIIPDIFDVPEDHARDEILPSDSSASADPTDELLESIDTLSLELEKAQGQINTQTQESSQETEPVEGETSGSVAEHLDTEGLDLEPLDRDEQERSELAEEEQLSAKEQVLETLSSEELALEPLDDVSDEAFIQEQEGIGQEQGGIDEDDATLAAASPKKETSNRPRNLRGEQAESESHSPADIADDNDALQTELFDQQNEQQTAQNINTGQEPIQTSEENSDSFNVGVEPAFDDNAGIKPGTNKISSDGGLPEDLVAEFFSETKSETDFEVNEVVRQFGEVSENFSNMNDDHLFDDDSTAGIKSKALDFVGTTTEKINELKVTINRKKTEFLRVLKGNKTTPDFHSSPFADSPGSDAIDALDLSSFDDFDRAPEPLADNPANSFFDEVVPVEKENKKTEAKPKEAEVKPASFNDDDIPFNFDEPPVKEPAQAKKAEATFPAATDMNFDFGSEDEPASNQLVNKIGDTLKHYKQKIAEMRQANAGEETSNDFEANSFDKYKTNLLTSFNNISLKANAKVMGAAVLGAGLLVGGIIVSLSTSSENSITNKRIENLAIDTHLLHSQFSNKLVADADSTIIEKLQWFSARIGHKIRLADIHIEDFEHKKVTVMPTMASYASSSIFENKAGQRMTVMIIPDVEGAAEEPLACRIPATVDGLCVWVKDSVRYIVVANLSLSRVRSFSQQIIEKL